MFLKGHGMVEDEDENKADDICDLNSLQIPRRII